MVKLAKLLCEGLRLNPLTSFQQLRNAKTITCYHASESSNFEPYDQPLHVGSIQQAMDLIKHMGHKNVAKFYLYKLEVNLGILDSELYDEDPMEYPEVQDSQLNIDSRAYTNRIEFPGGLRQGTNISVVIMNPKEQIISKELVKVV
jgi:hypothetical protein